MVKYESPQAGISVTKAVSASKVLTIDIFLIISSYTITDNPANVEVTRNYTTFLKSV